MIARQRLVIRLGLNRVHGIITSAGRRPLPALRRAGDIPAARQRAAVIPVLVNRPWRLPGSIRVRRAADGQTQSLAVSGHLAGGQGGQHVAGADPL
jgi:hypothetical protein